MTKILALITGANQGLGLAIARQLLSTGNFQILLGSRSRENADRAIRQLMSDLGNTVSSEDITPVAIDVSSDDSIIAAANFVNQRFGYLDILVNNAGTPGGIQRPELSQLRDSLHEVLDVNCVGPSVVTEAFLPLVRKSTFQDRRIVNVSSALGQIGLAFKVEHEWNARNMPVLGYRISKAALNMLTAVKAMELADENILVVSAAPGYTQTALSGGQGSKTVAEGAKAIVRAITGGVSQEMFGTLVANECTEFGW
ncbi:hypothetical protein LMH87_001086 [Akanthomyces muscarius]|uniref:Uncharacterized protein n=1 Tax=Akanthomyces muscarius TaxID=2231603 RepID=A0A9W8QGM9_AKAMU|nr:hypothetical protein LMH87_001086 [Akanthomyces muscarius]KAJ4155861.1 hypothetical protein LMH87_001086 [Akanthomyces muscarius]